MFSSPALTLITCEVGDMTILLTVAYVVTSVIAYGGLFAELQENNGYSDSYRQDMGFAMFFALIPFAGFIFSFFVTGFYKHGFKFI
jgi:hypothetical protein